MFNWFLPSKPPSHSEWAVLFWTFVALLVLAGLTGITFGYLAPPEKHEVAVALLRYGWRMLGLGLGLGLVVWLVRRWLD